jgi:hypothetical protein
VISLCALFGVARVQAELRYEVPGSLCWTYGNYPQNSPALSAFAVYYVWDLQLVAPDGASTTITTFTAGQGYGPWRSMIETPQTGTYKVMCHGTLKATAPHDGSYPQTKDVLMDQFDCTGNAIMGTIDESMTIDASGVETVTAWIANTTTVTINNLKDSSAWKGLRVDGTLNMNRGKVKNCSFSAGTGTVNIKDSTMVGNSFDSLAVVSLQGVTSQWDEWGADGPVDAWQLVRASNITIKECAFGDTPFIAAAHSLELIGNDFLGGVGTLSRSPVMKLQDNVFENGITDVTCTGATATIAGNSFYSDAGFRDAPAATSSNYWGGYEGCAELAPDGPNGWMSFYGVSSGWGAQETNFLRFEKGRATSLKPKRTVPTPFLLGRRIGQNALFAQTPAVRKGRPILVCFDVRVPAAKLDGVTFKLKCNGTEYAPTAGTVKTLRRDYFGHGLKNSVNFLLPASDEAALNYELMCDTTNVGGEYFAKDVFTLDWGTITQKGYFMRPLRVGYMNVNLPNRPVSAEEARAVADRLRDDAAALWPLREKDIVMVPMGPLDSDQSINFDGGICSVIYNTYLLNILDTAISNLHGIYNYGNANPVDMVVGVVPAGTLGAGNQGVSLALRRTVALIEAGQGESALHELGHGLVGLCTGTEQYDEAYGVRNGFHYVNGYGAEMRDTVAFNPSTHSSNGIAGGHAMHFPEAGHFGGVYFDFMGAGKNSWILPQNLRAVHNTLYSLLGETAHDPTITGGASGTPPPRPAPPQCHRPAGSWHALPHRVRRLAEMGRRERPVCPYS